MIRSWSFRQLFAKTWDRTPERDTAGESVSLRGMIESGDFKIDLDGRIVTLCGEELQLTSEEFDVLVFLAGHPQSLATPRTMLATSWSTNGLRQTEFLRVLISLRKKLDAAGPGKHYLRTEPWVVYRFNPSPSSAA
ncbi:MAG: winged helix-turn-helix domain-containing protein [Acidobacteriia bacterium]|nr:winged helix-turn-helix domain-containing protein [Terriglobia bacterium]